VTSSPPTEHESVSSPPRCPALLRPCDFPRLKNAGKQTRTKTPNGPGAGVIKAINVWTSLPNRRNVLPVRSPSPMAAKRNPFLSSDPRRQWPPPEALPTGSLPAPESRRIPASTGVWRKQRNDDTFPEAPNAGPPPWQGFRPPLLGEKPRFWAPPPGFAVEA